MAKIVFHHHKDAKKEKSDELAGWWTCPPSLEDLTEKQKNLLTKVWHKTGGKYIEDPFSPSQCYYAMLCEIPFGGLISRFIEKEHQYLD